MLRCEDRAYLDTIFNISAYCRLEGGYKYHSLSKAGDVKLNVGAEGGYYSQEWPMKEERSSLALVS